MSVECPYCGAEVEINHDDGYGYTEDEAHQQECDKCDKTFVFHTGIIFLYEAKKADCLNGSEHQWEPRKGWPEELFIGKERCSVCEEERDNMPAKERTKLMYGYFARLKASRD